MIVFFMGYFYVFGVVWFFFLYGVNNIVISVYDDELISIIVYVFFILKYYVSECSVMYYYFVLVVDCFSVYCIILFIFVVMFCNFKCSFFINVY